MNFDFSKQKHNILAIKEKTQTTMVRYDEITYVECNGSLVFVFHTKNHKPFSYSKSLLEIECELTDSGFRRINHNKVVNMQHVLNLNPKKHEITLTNEITLTVSRRKWPNIKEFFNS
jgi:DNA-binding LytR/AlgR family response regulator